MAMPDHSSTHFNQPMSSIVLASTTNENDEPANAAERVSRLFELSRTQAYNYAVAMGASPEIAEEVVQEAFLRLLAEFGRGKRVEKESGWLFRVVRNLVVDRNRNGSRESSIEDFDFEELCERTIDPHPPRNKPLRMRSN
jgi:DNA-directed RNA polymerase specialized sigma24 family protein